MQVMGVTYPDLADGQRVAADRVMKTLKAMHAEQPLPARFAGRQRLQAAARPARVPVASPGISRNLRSAASSSSAIADISMSARRCIHRPAIEHVAAIRPLISPDSVLGERHPFLFFPSSKSTCNRSILKKIGESQRKEKKEYLE